MKLQVLPLSQEAFSAYGDVIENSATDFFRYEQWPGGALPRFWCWSRILEQDRTLSDMDRAQPANLPLTIQRTLRLPLGTRLHLMKVRFAGCDGGDDKPDLSTLRAFITNGEQR
ncbi:ureidoglycolate lyase [Shigella flexneri]